MTTETTMVELALDLELEGDGPSSRPTTRPAAGRVGLELYVAWARGASTPSSLTPSPLPRIEGFETPVVGIMGLGFRCA